MLGRHHAGGAMSWPAADHGLARRSAPRGAGLSLEDGSGHGGGVRVGVEWSGREGAIEGVGRSKNPRARFEGASERGDSRSTAPGFIYF